MKKITYLFFILFSIILHSGCFTLHLRNSQYEGFAADENLKIVNAVIDSNQNLIFNLSANLSESKEYTNFNIVVNIDSIKSNYQPIIESDSTISGYSIHSPEFSSIEVIENDKIAKGLKITLNREILRSGIAGINGENISNDIKINTGIEYFDKKPAINFGYFPKTPLIINNEKYKALIFIVDKNLKKKKYMALRYIGAVAADLILLPLEAVGYSFVLIYNYFKPQH